MTPKKSTILIAVAVLLLEASEAPAQSEVILFKLESQATVYNHPLQKTLFRLDQPAFITKIWTYHWNNGRGANPGRIGLRNAATGQAVGMWNVTGTYHMFSVAPGAAWPSQGDGPPFLYWTVRPNISVPAGTYEVLDSDPGAWAYNAEMQNMGCAWVFGSYGSRGQVGPSPLATREVNPQPAIRGMGGINIAGNWTSTDDSFGSLAVLQSGSNINLKYPKRNGRAIGQLQANVFDGYWIQDFSGRRCSHSQDNSFFWGRMILTFTEDSYTGKWGYCDDASGTGFQGNRMGGSYGQVRPSPVATPQIRPASTPMSASVDVNGMWRSGNQTFIFYQEGQTIKVIDTYRSGSRIIVWYGEGTIGGTHVQYRLHHTRNTAPDAGDGIHEFTVTADGNTMNGTWGGVTGPPSGNWSLQRIGP
jgi:hypothetical protein